MKHTRGPWSLSGRNIVGPGGESIALVHSRREADKNGILLSSAPEMLGWIKRQRCKCDTITATKFCSRCRMIRQAQGQTC